LNSPVEPWPAARCGPVAERAGCPVGSVEGGEDAGRDRWRGVPVPAV